jgi:hypothetical protein
MAGAGQCPGLFQLKHSREWRFFRDQKFRRYNEDMHVEVLYFLNNLKMPDKNQRISIAVEMLLLSWS